LTDIHYGENKWQLLVQAVKEHKPDLVAIAGDLLPKDQGTLGQVSYLPGLRAYAEAINAAGAELVLILGNDDNRLAVPEMERGDEDGLWHYVADRVKEIKGYTLCGCPWIKDYPFGYKYWVAAETPAEICIDPLQLGPPVTITDRNEIEEIPDLNAYLLGKPSISASLKKIAGRVKEISNSIWLIHQPPAYLGLDICGSGEKAGSFAVYDFLAEKQPLLAVHGHIHESPEVNGQIWAAKLNRTLCIQAGQSRYALSYALFELEDQKIVNLAHSVYGSYRQC